MGSPVDPAAMWDERFSRPEAVYGHKPNAYLHSKIFQIKSGGRVLVPGDGYGRNGIWLARQGFVVHTVDISSVGVARARKAAQAAGLTMSIDQVDLSRWTWPESDFDAVVSVFLHLPPDKRPGIHAGMLRAVRPGGLLILEAFTPAQLRHSSGGPKQVELLYTAEMLRKDFLGAEVVELEEAEVSLDEGHLHRGPASVVHGVFRKK